MTAVCKRGYWMCCSVRRGASGASPALVLLLREFLACLMCCRVGMWCSEWCMRMRQIRNLRKCGCRWLGGDGQLRPRGVVDAGHVEERFPDDCGSVHYRGSTLQPAVLCLGPRQEGFLVGGESRAPPGGASCFCGACFCGACFCGVKRSINQREAYWRELLSREWHAIAFTKTSIKTFTEAFKTARACSACSHSNTLA